MMPPNSTEKHQWVRLLNPHFTEDNLYLNLPNMFILPVNPKYNLQCEYFWNKTVSEHNQDRMVHRFMQNYLHTVSNPSGMKSYFLFPFYIRDCFDFKNYTVPWEAMEDLLIQYSDQIVSFDLDSTIITATFPLDNPEWTHGPTYDKIKNVFGLRYLRVDNSLTMNGRDIYVPYYVPYAQYSRIQCNSTTDFECIIDEERKNLLFAPCKNSIAYMDTKRRWREMAYSLMNDTLNSIVTISIIESEFVNALHQSDFCIILPGDTVSSAKLYKAIFSGCIPVIFISFYQHLPFSRFIDWELFSILVRKEDLYFKDKIQALITRLMQIRQNKSLLYGLRSNLKLASMFFDWDREQWPSVYHFILLELVYSS